MKLTTIVFKALFFFLVFSSCNTEPDSINYGKDQCHFCKMNIVDRQHAAQYVTQKGKQFKFDAIECMINQIAEMDKGDIAVLLVSNYGYPGEMTNAITATYLVSPNLKSPMGAFLSAFKEKAKALQAQKEFSGELYDWEAIKKQLRKY